VATEHFLDGLDELVAVTWLRRNQLEDDEAKIARAEEASGAATGAATGTTAQATASAAPFTGPRRRQVMVVVVVVWVAVLTTPLVLVASMAV
jgi:hypothetical protein